MSLEQAGAGGRQCGGWLRSFCSRALRCGQIPRHVAIIMDGNRRFARKMQYERSFQGHVSGFDKLMETLEWCLELGITELTVYAFSIENFKRSREEVEGLMELAKAKIARLLEERDIIHRHGVRVRALGNLELLPSDVLEAVARVANFSRDNTRWVWSCGVAVVVDPGRSPQGRAQCLLLLHGAAGDGGGCAPAGSGRARGPAAAEVRPLPQLKPRVVVRVLVWPPCPCSDVSEELFGRCLYTEDSAPPDLVIRTSGEVRLSDFLLWQVRPRPLLP